MRKFIVVGISLLSLVGVGLDALAAEIVTMGELVVTASRQQEETVNVPAHISVVTADDIKNSTARNLAEVLRSQPGIQVSDIGGNQRNYNVDLRGFGESSQQNVLLLVDGRRVNLDDLSGPDWNLIPLDRIARIEIIRGSRGTVLYGDNATAGVINVITKEGRGALEATVSAAYGSYDTFKGHTAVSQAGDQLAYDISASYYDSDGYRDNSDITTRDLGANLRFDPSDYLRLHLSAGYHNDDTRNPGDLLQSDFDAGAERTDTTSPDDFDEVDDYYVKAAVEVFFLSDQVFKIETSYRNRDKNSFGTFSGGFFDADTETDIAIVSPRLIFKHHIGRCSNRMIIGADYSKSEQDYDSFSEFFGAPSEIKATLEKESRGFFIHDVLGIGDHLNLSGGYRDDRAKFSYEPSTPSRRTLDEEAYTLGANYKLNARSHVYASFTRGFRYPVLDEQFSYFSNTVDTTLDPQTSDNVEIGLAVEVFDGLIAGVNYFRTDTDDEIFYNPVSFANENIDGTTVRKGVELTAEWRYEAISLSGSYTRTETKFAGGPYDDNEVPFVPAHKATAKAAYRFDCGLSLGLDAVYIGKSYLISDFENQFEETDAYTVVNAKIQYDWHRYTFFADLNNLFDESYSAYSSVGLNPTTFEEEPGFYPSPKFNFMVGVAARFGAI